MLVLALASPFAALGFLFVMQGFEGWVLGAPSDVVPPDAIGVGGMAEDDLAARTRSLLGEDRSTQPGLSAVAARADLFGGPGRQNTAAKYSNHGRHAA